MMTFGIRLVLSLCVVAAVAAPWPPGYGARAQGTGKTPVIAVVNYAQAIHDSKAGQSLRQQFDKQRDVYEKEIKKAETKLEEAQQELKQQQAVLSPEAFARKRQEFQKAVRAEFQRTRKNDPSGHPRREAQKKAFNAFSDSHFSRAANQSKISSPRPVPIEFEHR